MKRRHQAEFERIIDGIIAGSETRKVLLRVTPGGGKSAIPIIAGKLVKAKMADALCWVVPRKSLQDQGERNFLDPMFREIFFHGLTIRSSTNDVDPCRGTSGFVTTYQAIGTDSRPVAYEFGRKRFILILDEFHHVEERGLWHEALRPIVELAGFVILMTGTLERGDESKIAFIPYASNRPDIRPRPGFEVIEYSRADALAERAIIPLQFFLHDSATTWEDALGVEVAYQSFADTRGKDIAAAIYTALSTDYANELMRVALGHWLDHRRNNPRSKMLVITANIGHAQKAVADLKALGLNAEIATSHDSGSAHDAIKAFKFGGIEILVTIAMAYEGLDVPAVTHEVCLTHIRSTPWIEQMIARAVRVDRHAGPYEKQFGFIFAPDDPFFRAIVSKIRAEQLPAIKERMKQVTPKDQELFDFPGVESSGEFNRLGIVPLGSRLIGSQDVMLGHHGLPVPQPKTQAEIEETLRRRIESHVRLYSFNNRYQDGQINRELLQYFGKKRADMTVSELERVDAYIEEHYPLTRRRGTGRRVSNRVSPWTGQVRVFNGF